MARARSKLKKELLELLDKDLEFRYAVAGYLGLGEVLKRLDRHEEVLEKLRRDMIEGFRRHDEALERHWQAVERLRADMIEGFRRHEEEIAKLWSEIAKLRRDMIEGFRRHEEEIARLTVSVDRLSRTVERLTVSVEEEALNVIEHRLKMEMGVEVKLRRVFVDDEEVDIYGSFDDTCIIGEATVRLGVGLVEELEEKVELIKRRRPEMLRPKLIKVIYADYAYPQALEEARRRGIWVLKWSGDMTPRAVTELA